MKYFQVLKKKFLFTSHLIALGADFHSRQTLLLESLRIQGAFYLQKSGRPFSFTVQAFDRTAEVHLTGTLDELHQLLEIFTEPCYEMPPMRPATLLDLGANIGLASIWFSLLYPGIRIDAYEPNPDLQDILKRNLSQFPSVHIIQAALGAHDGTMKFYKSTRSVMSSLHPVPDSVAIEVPIVTLDTAVEAIGGHVDLVKIDIEGGEFDVFQTTHALAKIRAIVGEAHPLEEGRSLQELRDSLAKTHRVETSATDRKSAFRALPLNS